MTVESLQGDGSSEHVTVDGAVGAVANPDRHHVSDQNLYENDGSDANDGSAGEVQIETNDFDGREVF